MTTVFKPNRMYRRSAKGRICVLCPLRMDPADVVGLRDELTGDVDFAHLACVSLVIEMQGSGPDNDVHPDHISTDPSID